MQRSQPFVGWQPLPTAEWDAHDTQYLIRQHSGGGADLAKRVANDLERATFRCAPGERGSRSGIGNTSASISCRTAKATGGVCLAPIDLRVDSHSRKRRQQLSGDLSGPHERPMEAAVQPVAPRARREIAGPRRAGSLARESANTLRKTQRHPREAWGSEPPLAAPTQRREEQPLERPALRLAILRPINTAAGTVQRKESDPLSSGSSRFSMAETNDLRGLEYSLVEEQSAFPPRLVSSVSSLQPQEVRGGFPVAVAAEVRR